jgi:hypothetical protein
MHRRWQNWVVSVFELPSISFGGRVLLSAILLAVPTSMIRRAAAVGGS